MLRVSQNINTQNTPTLKQTLIRKLTDEKLQANSDSVKISTKWMERFLEHEGLKNYSQTDKQINVYPLVQKMRQIKNPQIKIVIKRHNIHLSVVKGQQNQLCGNKLKIETDQKGFSKTKDSISENIINSLGVLQIENKKVFHQCFNILNKIIFNVPIAFRSKPHRAIALVIIFKACRVSNETITLKQIYKVAQKFKLSIKTINRCLKSLNQLLPKMQKISKPIDFLRKISNQLNLDDKIKDLATIILQKIENYQLINNGQHPNTIAASAVYIASEIISGQINLKIISEAAQSAQQTIKNASNKLIQNKLIYYLPQQYQDIYKYFH